VFGGAAMTFGEILFGLRNDKFMTRETLAALLGVSVEEVDRWERNEKLPSERELRRIADIFNLDADYFVACSRGTLGDMNLDNAHISFKGGNFAPKLTEDEKARLKKGRRKRIIFGIVDFVLTIAAITVFFTIGFTMGKWHPAWAAFPIAIAIVQLMYVLGYKRRKKVIIIDSIWLFSVIMYLFTGIFYDTWDPTWMIFVVDIVLTIIVNLVFWIIKKNK